MSLEEALNANTAALTELIAVLKNTKPETAQAIEPDKPKAPKPKAEKKAEAPKPAEPEAPKVARKDVGDALMALAESKGRDAARALLARFDVKVLADAKPEQYPDIKAAAEKEMA